MQLSNGQMWGIAIACALVGALIGAKVGIDWWLAHNCGEVLGARICRS
jgi:type III secretory pathway component EscT